MRARTLAAIGIGALLSLIVLPGASIEAFCRANADPNVVRSSSEWRVADSFLKYPEWHIVYAYEGMAHVLENGDEHRFAHLNSIAGFWSSFCLLSREADVHGGATDETRVMVHVIGASFTLEVLAKAAYEETLGRLVAAWRGPEPTAQDLHARRVARDYAEFLQQTPWYMFDFAAATRELWALPATDLRSWERRLALGLEWTLKSGYASLLAGAVAATGDAPLRIEARFSSIDPDFFADRQDVVVLGRLDDTLLVDATRYRAFTDLMAGVARAGGEVVEIGGNRVIMVSILSEVPDFVPDHGVVITRMSRDGFSGERSLVRLTTSEIGSFVRGLSGPNARLEHVYDY